MPSKTKIDFNVGEKENKFCLVPVSKSEIWNAYVFNLWKTKLEVPWLSMFLQRGVRGWFTLTGT